MALRRPQADVDAGTGANCVEKVCAVLRTLSVGRAHRLSDVTAATGFHKVTALRILETLAQQGFVFRDPDTKAFALGHEALAMAASMRDPGNLTDFARPAMMRLASQVGDTVLLSVRTGTDAIYVGREVGRFPLQPNFLHVGSRRPLGIGAASLALLATLPEDEAEAALEDLTRHLSTYPLLSTALLRDGMERARRCGHALVIDTVNERMGGIGVVVRDSRGRVLGALSVAALSDRIRDREPMLAEALHRAARAVTRASEAAAAGLGQAPREARRWI
jgi:DNA-binding IclR family transcriptional regulator